MMVRLVGGISGRKFGSQCFHKFVMHISNKVAGGVKIDLWGLQ